MSESWTPAGKRRRRGISDEAVVAPRAPQPEPEQQFKILKRPPGFNFQAEAKGDELEGKRPSIVNYGGQIPTKTSYGVILIRLPKTEGNEGRAPEVALVKKRYTYTYAEFVHARANLADDKAIQHLLDEMTTDELLDIWSLNFDLIWHRIWPADKNLRLFTRKQAKFLDAFIRPDGGARLRALVKQSKCRGVLHWEAPKGKKKSARESDVICAIRELNEEAGVEKKDYAIIPEAKERETYVHMGVKYVTDYYIALANPWLSGRPFDPRDHLQALFAGEVSEVRWMTLAQVRAVDVGKKIEALVGPALKIAKAFAKGKWRDRAMMDPARWFPAPEEKKAALPQASRQPKNGAR